MSASPPSDGETSPGVAQIASLSLGATTERSANGKLPAGMTFDLLRPEDVGNAARMEKEAYGEDAASLEKLR
jgi:hypothetical protein